LQRFAAPRLIRRCGFAKSLEKIIDLGMHFLGLGDNQQAVEIVDRSRPADIIPTIGLDR